MKQFNNSDDPFYIAFSVFPGIGPVRFRLLVEYFGTAQKAFEAKESQLVDVGLPKPIVERFVDFKRKFSLPLYIKELEKRTIRTITCSSSEYPSRLHAISDAPIVLYMVGDAPFSFLSDPKMIAIVGTRMITDYGKEVTRKLTQELVASGVTIVSGLALGVDAIAHKTTIDMGGKTIAVLGCGVDIIAPSSNTYIYEGIIKSGGLIISEMPLGHLPGRGLFPARNRIISGLSLGVVVTEGAEDSGALITARYAAEQGREVFAVPGPITSLMSKGPAKLLKNGATIVESAKDILEGVSLSSSQQKPINLSLFSEEEKEIMLFLSNGPKHSNEIVRYIKKDSTIIFSLLTTLELKGVIVVSSESVYSLA